MRKCRDCGLEANIDSELELFATNATCKYGKDNLCKECANIRRQKSYTPEKYKEYAFKKKYGITKEDYNIMFNEQNGCCKICSKHQSELSATLAVDHNHLTGDVRGLLCGSCNRGIGLLQDDVGLLKAAIKYIEDNGSYAVSRR